jgi:hypothetical protein
MAKQEPITDRILEHLGGSPDVTFETLVSRCPEFTCGEVFREVARLSRMGQVRVTKGAGLFSITPRVPVRTTKSFTARL